MARHEVLSSESVDSILDTQQRQEMVCGRHMKTAQHTGRYGTGYQTPENKGYSGAKQESGYHK